jgi:TPR repeat protein/chromosome segregation ATPase
VRNSAALTRFCFPAKIWRAIFGVVLLAGLGRLTVCAQSAPPLDLVQLRAKAEQADPDAQNTLGNAYSNALGVKQDYAAALIWYRRAAENGFAPAQFNLGLVYELGRGVKADEFQAFKYYMMAAEQGFGPAQFNVGNMYSAGHGIGQDLFEANLWYKQAAEKGITEAQFNLGLAYETGRGVKKDEVQAARWYKQAADRGFARAQYNLGLLLEDGRGIAKNEATAAALYRAAAEQGFASAQNNYGLMISEGRGGLTKDPVQAFVWLSLAAQNGANPAARDFVARGLTPEQLATAQQLLNERKIVQTAPVPPAPLRNETVAAATEPVTVPAAVVDDARGAARLAELTDALEKAREANAQYAEANQRLELEKARLEHESGQGGESGKLIEQLREQNRRLAVQVQSLATEKETAESETAVLAAQIKDARQEQERLKKPGSSAATTSSADLAKYQSQVAALTARLDETTHALAQAQQANLQLTDNNARLQKDKESHATEAAAVPVLPAAGAKYPAQQSDKDAILTSLQHDNARLNDEVKRSTRELLSLNQQLRNLRNQPAKPVASGAGDNTATAEIRTENERVDANNNRLQSQRDAAVRDAENLTAQLHDARDEIARLNEQVQKLQSTRQSADTANDQLGQLTAKAGQAEQDAGRLQTENNRLAARIAELEKQSTPAADQSLAPKLAEAQQALAQQLQQVQALQAEKGDLEKWSQSLEKSLNEKSAATQSSGAEMTGLRQKLADVQKQLDGTSAALATQGQLQQKLTLENRALTDRAGRAEEALAAQTARKTDTVELDRLKQQLDEAHEQAARLTRDNQALTDKVADEHGKSVQAEARVTALERDLGEARQKKTTGTTGLDDLKKQLGETNQALEKSSAAAAGLTDTNNRLEKELEAAKQGAQDASALRDEVAKLRQEAAGVASLHEEHQALAARAATEHENLAQAQARQAALEHDLSEARQQALGGAAVLDDLKKQLGEANQALEKGGATVAELTGTNARLEQELTASKQGTKDVGALHDELAKLRHDVAETASLREENGRLRPAADEASALRAKNEQLARDNEQVTSFMTSNRRDLDQAQARLADLEKQLEEARTIRTHGGDDTKKLQGELAEAGQTIEKLNATVAELTGTNDRLEKDLDSARKSTAAALAAQSQAVTAAQPDAYKMEISTLQARVKELEGQNEDERNSTAKEVAGLASQLQRTRETNKSLTEANRALMSAKQSEQPTVDKDQFDQLQAKVHDLTTAADEVRRQNQKLNDDNQRLATEEETLKQQLADARKVATVLPGLADEKAALQERLEAVGTQLVKAQQEVDTLQKENADATSQVIAGKQAAEKAQADLAALQGRATEAEKASEAHNASVAELTDANTKLEAERDDFRKQLTALRAENIRLNQTASSLGQLKADADRSAQQNIEALTAQLTQSRRDLQSARDANSRLVEGTVAQERERAANLAQLRQENSALTARLVQAQSTLDQIASAARLGTPAATIASGGTVPVRPVPVVSTSEPQVRYHTVGEGDSLSRISMRYYGTPNRWQEIFQANRDVLQGSSALRIGMQLRIP